MSSLSIIKDATPLLEIVKKMRELIEAKKRMEKKEWLKRAAEITKKEEARRQLEPLIDVTKKGFSEGAKLSIANLYSGSPEGTKLSKRLILDVLKDHAEHIEPEDRLKYEGLIKEIQRIPVDKIGQSAVIEKFQEVQTQLLAIQRVLTPAVDPHAPDISDAIPSEQAEEELLQRLAQGQPLPAELQEIGSNSFTFDEKPYIVNTISATKRVRDKAKVQFHTDSNKLVLHDSEVDLFVDAERGPSMSFKDSNDHED